MLSLNSGHRYHLYRGVTDMRKSFNGLSGIVLGQMKKELLSGDVFIFVNRKRDRMKLLVWDRGGFIIWYKRLEQGTFELPSFEGKSCELNWEKLVLIIGGVKLDSVRHRKRYNRVSLPQKIVKKQPLRYQ